ncbi:MAG: M16 family metallopeptidase [Phycisphaerales bacterium]
MNVKTIAAACLVFGGAGGNLVAGAEPLPTDPALTAGKLENGMAYVIREHATPPGHVSVRLHISSGSLNETDKQRGLAHYLEHMAFNGSKNFPPGSVVPLFESLGLTFGRDQNASTGMESTTYMLDLANNDAEKLEKAFTFMGDVAFGMLLDAKEIDAERNIILNEKRARSGAQQRAGDYFMERLTPGSLYGVRSPIGTEETILGAQREDFVDYYTKRYVPSNMTIVVVGDLPAAEALRKVQSHFSAGKASPRPEDQDPRIAPTSGVRGLVFADPEITSLSLGAVRVMPAREATTTVEGMRRELVEDLGQAAFARRCVDKVSGGGVAFFSCFAGVSNSPGVMRQARLSASGKPERWHEVLADAATELQRARLHGFVEREIEDAKREMIASAEAGATRESTTPTRGLVQRYLRQVAAEEPIVSAAQRLDLLRRLLPEIKVDEVSAAFREAFDFSSAVYTMTLPSAGEVPSEDELAAAGAKAMSVRPEKEAGAAVAATLLPTLPTPGTIVERATHQASGVTTAWLSNGVRVNHRFMDTTKNSVTFQVLMAGGTIGETNADRGIAEAAAIAWGLSKATKSLSSAQIRDITTGWKAQVIGGGGGGGGGRGGRGGGGGTPAQDSLGMLVASDHDDAEKGLQLAYLLLTEPRLEPAAFDNWQQRQLQSIQAQRRTPAGMASLAYQDQAYPAGEARLRSLTSEQVEALSLDRVQAWLDRFVRTAPLEITIIGDLPTERALQLAAAYFGALPQRERVTPSYLKALRDVPHPPKPVNVALDVQTTTEQAVVRVGFHGPDADSIRDVRLMELAANVVSSRMVKVIREERVLVYSIRASFQPGEAYPGWGAFQAGAPCEPAKSAALAASIREVFDTFARTGPTDEELATAKKQVESTLSEAMKQNGYWTQRLNGLAYRGRSLDDIAQGPEAYADISAAEVRDAFVKYDRPERRFSVRVTPTDSGG